MRRSIHIYIYIIFHRKIVQPNIIIVRVNANRKQRNRDVTFVNESFIEWFGFGPKKIGFVHYVLLRSQRWIILISDNRFGQCCQIIRFVSVAPFPVTWSSVRLFTSNPIITIPYTNTENQKVNCRNKYRFVIFNVYYTINYYLHFC